MSGLTHSYWHCHCLTVQVELMTPDHRFLQPAPTAVKTLTPAQFAAALSAQLTNGAVHVAAVGDFDARELEMRSDARSRGVRARAESRASRVTPARGANDLTPAPLRDE